MTTKQPSNESESTAAEESGEEQQEQKTELFPIVGIAASAGGLEAFTELLNHLPTNTGMAFVLIQHLAPDHKSLLTEILARTTRMSVIEVQDGTSVEPNHVYVIPPNTKMTLSQGVLQLAAREKVHGKYMPGDAFFVSLAADRGNKAIAVILSGGDGDGSLGLESIKVAGGVTFAQCEASAKFDSMPNTAVATGNVDFILPPQKIAEELAQLSRHSFVSPPLAAKTAEETPEVHDAMSTIFALLQAATGVDFSYYKQTTIERRIGRRMLLYKLKSLEDYVRYIQNNPTEVKALYQEMLINVTSFFRDPNAFQALKEQVFPTITQHKSAESSIRIWVTGCSTGEEVYSIAICLLEFLEDRVSCPSIQIFATDIDEAAIEKARAGIYQENQMVDVSPERRHRFFLEMSGGYQISTSIRKMCVFARQNLISDPPFSNLDLISCRNMLIYFEPTLQKRVIPIFHYGLNPTGFLLLGTSESISEFSDLFNVVNKKYKIYSKKLTSTPLHFSFVTSKHPIPSIGKSGSTKEINEVSREGFDPQKEADRIILNRYAPVGVLINEKLEILQFRGETSPYLRPAPGKPSFNLLKMVREDLLVGLRSAIYQARKQNVSIRKEGLGIEGSDQLRGVNIDVIPLISPLEEHCFLVLFEDAHPFADNISRANSESLEPQEIEPEIIQLKQELSAANLELVETQEYLQAIIQGQEASNQDLKIANEEILSSNEELQSTNEELETAKEEIQATNEELKTINQELQSRNLELHQLNNDLTNLLGNVNISILMLASDLRIRRFTPMAQKTFNLIPTDVGRPLGDIRPNIDVPNLESLILEVIETLSVKELEVQDQKGHWYTLRIRPYRTTENQIDGAVLVLLDIDALKRGAAKLEEARDYAEAIVETVQEPLIVLNAELQVLTANRSFYETFQVLPLETQQHLIFELGNGQWNIPSLKARLEDVLSHNVQIQNFEVEHHFEQIGHKTMLLNAQKIPREGDVRMLLLTIEDITEQKQFDTERTQLLAQAQSARLASEAAQQAAETASRAKDEFLAIVSHELRNPLNAILGWSHLLRMGKLDKATAERAIAVIESSSRAQNQLIEDILDISRITTGKISLNARLINLVPVIEAAIEVVRLSADAKNIQIQSQLNLETVRVLGDSNRLQQVVWNLLSNAIKFTPVGGRVEVTLEPLETQVQIRVSDTGQGIPASFLPHVFERFSQADGSTTRSLGGLGLGLSIVRYLVELHGGTVQAESLGEGQGTTISVRLPLQTSIQTSSVPSALERVNIACEPGLPVDDSLLEGVWVLVVDDEADVRELLTTILTQYKAKVTAVASVREALSALKTNPGLHDVLLSDIGMPDQDGYTLMRQVRALTAEEGGQIPAAALTAYITSKERQEALSAGFQMHIAKPVESAQLVFMVANLAGRVSNG